MVMCASKSHLPFGLGDVLEVEVERLSFGGNGVARYKEAVIFVPLSCPGDRVRVSISKFKKRYAEADLLEVLHPGSDRRKAPCEVYGQCGGCDWQHIAYEAQLKFKQEIVLHFMKPFLTSATVFDPISPSPKPFNYRNRAVLKYKNKRLGFYQRNSHHIINIDRCWLLEEPLSDRLPGLRSMLDEKNQPADIMESVVLSCESSESCSTAAENEGFSQVNCFQNEILRKIVLQLLAGENETIFDLYAGSGNFTLSIIKQQKRSPVVGVELHSEAARVAQQRLKSMKIPSSKAEFYNSDVGVFLRRAPVRERDVVLLNPPRSGCEEEVISLLAQSKPVRIIYISCDPATLARDLGRFQKYSHNQYRLSRLQCFDMFPQTHHVETLIELRRDGGELKI